MEVKIGVLSYLLCNTWMDLKYRKISFWMSMIYGFVGVVLFIVLNHISWFSLIGGVAIGGIIFLISKLTKGGIGIGDSYLIAVTGIFLGLEMNITLLMYALFLSSLYSVLLFFRKKFYRKKKIPFAPFLLLAYLFMEGMLVLYG